MNTIWFTDTLVHALALLVDDFGSSGIYREPPHSDIEFQVNFVGLSRHYPKQQASGKAVELNTRPRVAR